MQTTAKSHLMTLNEVAALIGVTRHTITAWVKQRRFPKPLRIGRRRRFWSRESVEQAIGQ
jgi:excisionase family DNA binding protein